MKNIFILSLSLVLILSACSGRTNSQTSVEECESKKSKMAVETLYSSNEAIEINYSNYQLVVIPEQSSQYDSLLDEKTVTISDTGYESLHKFSVIGQVESAQFTYVENPLAADVEEKIVLLDERIKDTIVTLKASLPTDFSHVKVMLTYLKDDQEKQIEFVLDGIRDPESYEIIKIE